MWVEARWLLTNTQTRTIPRLRESETDLLFWDYCQQ